MKYFVYMLLLVLFFVSTIATAQNNHQTMPDSYYIDDSENSEDIDHIVLAPLSESLIKNDNAKDGSMYVIGSLLPVELTPENSGTWTSVTDDLQIWRLRLSSEKAKASALHFEYFKLQENSRLFVYNTDYSVVMGPFDSNDNPEALEYSIGVLLGGDIIVEYIVPTKESLYKNPEQKPDFKISSYAYIYRGEYLFFDMSKQYGYGTSGDCQVNINCLEGNNWRIQQRGITRIYVVDGVYVGYCTGSLINNTANDLTPYVLTANHCGEGTSDSDFRQWRFDFHYESVDCTENVEPSKNSFVGCTKKASAPLQGGSDFLLVQINASPENLKSCNVVYNGWRIDGEKSPSGVCIHHPSGDIKKISTYSISTTSATYNGDERGATNACWKVRWSSSPNGHGVTEGGSSGSPLFDNNAYIIGTLSGGSSYCDYTLGNDFYGKMSYHWTSNGTYERSQLKTWLDPINSGATTCEYLDPNTGSSTCSQSSNSKFSIFPNPNFGTFYVYSETATGLINIYDELGKTIKTIQIKSYKEQIDISRQKPGVYIVEILNEDKAFVKKIIVE
ncbi:T9SS type A sorting domain-containing protein [Bacteroidales bacterium OttesenSCG-928-I21]|nr:T9SS type A sorting domain-containing protein [Bacteroidales bacterium OttesenSCG-928-I21]